MSRDFSCILSNDNRLISTDTIKLAGFFFRSLHLVCENLNFLFPILKKITWLCRTLP